MENNLHTSITSSFAIVIIIVICAYVSYLLVRNNNILNLGLKDKTIDTNINVSKQDNLEENIVAQKEIVYEYEEIASYSSTLLDNEKNRIYNIQKACETLNETVVSVGQEFSFNDTIGPMGEENGYLKATGFDSNGKNIQISAGGMCQVSSTLYNVLLISGVEITERHPHSKRVYYVPIDKDATVFYGSLDLKFVNNLDSDVIIYANTDGYTVNVSMQKIKQSN